MGQCVNGVLMCVFNYLQSDSHVQPTFIWNEVGVKSKHLLSFQWLWQYSHLCVFEKEL